MKNLIFLISVFLFSNCSKKETATNMSYHSDISTGRVSNITCNQFDGIYHSYLTVNTNMYTLSFTNRTIGECSNINLHIGDELYLLNEYTAENNKKFNIEKFELTKGHIDFDGVFILQNNKRTIKL
jgi:hypothetical protein